jgi:glycosyltransferase involved in cell wall biosynthesis
MLKNKVAIVTAWYAPYRVPLFREISLCQDIDLTVIFCSSIEAGRTWVAPKNLPFRSIFLNSKTIYHYKVRKMFGERGIVRYPSGIFRVLRSLNPDIVVAYEFRLESILAALFTAIFRKVYITWSDVTAQYDSRMGFMRRIIRQILLLRSKALIGSSTDTLTHFQESYNFPPHKSFLSILSAHVDDFKQLVPDALKSKSKSSNVFRLIYVGRLIPLKGMDLLISAFATLRLEYPNSILTIIGDGPEREKLDAQIKDLDCERHVIFKGSVAHHQLPQELVSHDVFVLPTRLDCFGLVIAEAIACELPVICSCFAGAANDLVKDNGIIVDPTNREAFLAALKKLAFDHNLQMEMSKAAGSILKIHNQKTAVSGFLEALHLAALRRC